MTEGRNEGCRSYFRPGVVVVAEHLRRAVPGGIGVYTAGLIDGVSRLEASIRPPLSLFASRSPGRPDLLDGFGVPVQTSALPSATLLVRFSAGFPASAKATAVVHAASLMVPPAAAAPLTVALHDIAFRAVPEAYLRTRPALARGGAAPRRPPRGVLHRPLAGDRRCRFRRRGRDRCRPDGHSSSTAPTTCRHQTKSAIDGVLHRLGIRASSSARSGPSSRERTSPGCSPPTARRAATSPEPWPLVDFVGPTGWGPGAGALPPGVVFAGEVAPSVLADLYRRARLGGVCPAHRGFWPPGRGSDACRHPRRLLAGAELPGRWLRGRPDRPRRDRGRPGPRGVRQ